MGRLPERWLQELHERADIREIAARYVQLEEKGGRFWGCCPFHHETKPSFTVSPDKGFYHCFGCGKHGSAVNFIMEMEHLGFREACEYLAGQLGMEMPQDESPADRTLRHRAARTKQMNRTAASFYYKFLSLPAGAGGRLYFEKRGIDTSLIKHYGLGYAPDGWHHLRDHLLKSGYTREELAYSGLVHEKNGSAYDVFRSRVLFPIIDPQGEIIGFGGRVLDDSLPKYLNSPATPAFNKSRSLYNLNVIKRLKNAGSLDALILMEGYMDVVGAARFGIENACATLGTALTSEQARLLGRYTRTVHICYDGDAAGTKAALRALKILEEAGLAARVIHLPDGMDPDEYLRAHGREAYLAQTAAAMEPMAFRFYAAGESLDLHDPVQRAQYAEKCLTLLKEEKSALVREQYLKKLQEETGYTLAALKEDLTEKQRVPAAGRTAAPASPAGADRRAENFVAAVLGGIPDLAAELVLIVKEEDFQYAPNRAVYTYIAKQDGRPVGREELQEMLSEQEAAHLKGLLKALERYETDTDQLRQMLSSSICRLSARRINNAIAKKKAELAQLSDPQLIRNKQEEIRQLTAKLHEWREAAASAPVL